MDGCESGLDSNHKVLQTASERYCQSASCKQPELTILIVMTVFTWVFEHRCFDREPTPTPRFRAAGRILRTTIMLLGARAIASRDNSKREPDRDSFCFDIFDDNLSYKAEELICSPSLDAMSLMKTTG